MVVRNSFFPSVVRRRHSKPLLIVLLFCYSIYYIVNSCSAAHEHILLPLPAVLHKAAAADRVTVTRTIKAPAATVTAEVFVPRAAPVLPPLLNGPATPSFPDNLRPELKYVTAWPGAGFTNNVIEYMNLIYLGLSTNRVPVVPFFRPLHITNGDNHHGPNIDFGDVFDMERLEEGLGKRVLEWYQVKERDSYVVDPLGCWNVRQAVQPNLKEPYYSSMPDLLNLDISYTTAPPWIKLRPEVTDDPFFRLPSLVTLAYPTRRNENLPPPVASALLKASLPPDEHLLCFDNLYFGSTIQPHEIQSDFSPAWNVVGQHLHWKPFIEDLAQEYVRVAFGLDATATVPPYIAVHVRHGDFAGWCGTVPVSDCFAPLPAIARRVAEVRAALLASKKMTVERVIVTSDERDPVWWAAVRAQGWAAPDHAQTAKLYGKWYPVLVDAAIQSGALGLVGTDQSTVSILAGKRVREWQGGEVSMVRWGRVGADDH